MAEIIGSNETIIYTGKAHSAEGKPPHARSLVERPPSQEVQERQPKRNSYMAMLYVNRLDENGRGFKGGHVEWCSDLEFDTVEPHIGDDGVLTITLNGHKFARAYRRSDDTGKPSNRFNVHIEGELWAELTLGDDRYVHNPQALTKIEATDRDSLLYNYINLLSHYLPAARLREWVSERESQDSSPRADVEHEAESGTAALEEQDVADRIATLSEEFAEKTKERRSAMPSIVNTQVILRSRPDENPAIVCSLVVGRRPEEGAVRIEHWYYDDKGNPVPDDPNHGDSIDIPFKLIPEVCRVLENFESAAFVMALGGYLGDDT